MIGKPEWFKRRKYGGWGIFPKTWQGWAYLVVVLGIFVVFQALPFWSNTERLVVTGIWALFLVVDVAHIMLKVNRDEREKIHEAIAERNALWAILAVLIVGIGYQVASSATVQDFSSIDPFLVAAVAAALIAKAASNLYLDRKN
jgi:hypothetical protein